MSRKAIFDGVKVARGGKSWSAADIQILDEVLDRLGVPRPETTQTDALVPSRACYETIKEFESCELEAYPDPGSGGDPWTIGWGSTGPGIRKGVTWTQAQADERLKEDVAKFADGVRNLLGGAATSQQEFDALVSFAYNVGLGNLGSSTLLKLHKAGDKVGAAKQFARWDKAAGRTLRGLTRRREAEAKLYRGEI